MLNGAHEELQFLIQYSTHPEVASRIDSVADFLSYLDEVAAELTEPEPEFIEDPSRAQQGDLLPGSFTVVRRLGQGACAVALLVEREGQEYVLKVASDPEHNQRLQDEGEVLSLNLSLFVGRKNWLKSWGSLACFSAHLVKIEGPHRGLLGHMYAHCDQLQTLIN